MLFRKPFLLLPALLGLDAQALTFGPTQGQVLLGKPLALQVEVSARPDEELSLRCLHVELAHGETVVDVNRVRLALQPATASRPPVLSVRSEFVVDEAFVALTLRTACGPLSTRRYALLAEPEIRAATGAPAPVVREAASPPAAAPVSRPVASAVVAAPAASAPVQQASAPIASSSRPTPAVARPTAASRPTVAPSAEALRNRPVAKTPAPVSSAPKLKIVGSELPTGVLGGAGLRSTMRLSSIPTDDAAVRAQAASLWKELNASPETLRAETARAARLEAEVQALQAVRAELEVAKASAAAQPDAGSGGSADWNQPVLWGLAGGLLLALGALGWLALQRRKDRRVAEAAWWQGTDAPAQTESGRAPPRPHMLVDIAPVQSPAPLVPDLPGVAGSLAAPLAPRSLDPLSSFGPDSTYGVAEEVFDVRQHAEFYVSLGQYEQAIDLLTSHIDNEAHPSPLAFVDLLRIHHTLSHSDDYQVVRDRFQKVHHVRVPAFADFTRTGRHLEDHPDSLAALVNVWGDLRGVALLRHWIGDAHTQDPSAQRFDLPAFQELVLLLDMAQDLGFEAIPPPAELSPAPAQGAAGFPAESESGGDYTVAVPPRRPGGAAASSDLDFDLGSNPSPLADFFDTGDGQESLETSDRQGQLQGGVAAPMPQRDEDPVTLVRPIRQPLPSLPPEVGARSPAPRPLDFFNTSDGAETVVRAVPAAANPAPMLDVDLDLLVENPRDNPPSVIPDLDLEALEMAYQNGPVVASSPAGKAARTAHPDPNLIDFDLFDLDTPPKKSG